MKIDILPAVPEDAPDLTKIAFAAKRYWHYPPHYLEIWKDELTVTAAYIEGNKVYKALADGNTVGFYSTVHVPEDFVSGRTPVKKGFYMDHLFIQPEHIGLGAGTALFAHAVSLCRKKGIPFLYVMSDPNAKGFYDKKGAVYIGEIPSSIEGRTVALYRIDCNE